MVDELEGRWKGMREKKGRARARHRVKRREVTKAAKKRKKKKIIM